jgi:hypothetical protein
VLLLAVVLYLLTTCLVHEQRWTNEADVMRDAFPTGEQLVKTSTSRIASAASAATSATAVAVSRSASTSSEWLPSEIDSIDNVLENDVHLLLRKLRAAEAERDAALAELAHARRSVVSLPYMGDGGGENSRLYNNERGSEEWTPVQQVSLLRV